MAQRFASRSAWGVSISGSKSSPSLSNSFENVLTNHFKEGFFKPAAQKGDGAKLTVNELHANRGSIQVVDGLKPICMRD